MRNIFGATAFGAVFVSVATSACVNAPAALTELVTSRRLAGELHVNFSRAADASSRAVLAETDETATSAAEDARRSRQAIEQGVIELRALVQSLGYADDAEHLDRFQARFDAYRQLDDDILQLAVENSNVKAQRLAFGPAREAAQDFRKALAAAVNGGAPADRSGAELTAARAGEAILEIQAVQPRHIAEPEDAPMTQMEGEMARSEAAAREALARLANLLSPSAEPALATASAALDRFKAINDQILILSRRNSDVRSLALSLGRKRTLTAACEDELRTLDAALAGHESIATR